MITRHFRLRGLQYMARMRFSVGHDHHAVYDWRDDPSVNESYEQDPRQVGLKDCMEYHFPHTAKVPQWVYSAPANYNHKDLTQNLK